MILKKARDLVNCSGPVFFAQIAFGCSKTNFYWIPLRTIEPFVNVECCVAR